MFAGVRRESVKPGSRTPLIGCQCKAALQLCQRQDASALRSDLFVFHSKTVAFASGQNNSVLAPNYTHYRRRS
jgi:hypothetical protein